MYPKKNHLYLCVVFCLLLLCSCKRGSNETNSVFQSERSNVIDVSARIQDIKSQKLIGKSILYIFGDYLLALELKPSADKAIHVFNRDTFEYVFSFGVLGYGPGEITRSGKLGIDEINKIIWVPDFGKKLLMKFPFDSVLQNDMFKPSIVLPLSDEMFIEDFECLGDSIALGTAVRPLSGNTFEKVMAKFNLFSGQIEQFGYENPEMTGKLSRSSFCLSTKEGIYVNAYITRDLLTICNVDGSLRCNVFGPDGLVNEDEKKSYFFGVEVANQKIIASYINDASIVLNEFKRQQGNLPTKFVVFDSSGAYLSTLETKHFFTFFCVDELNNRIIISFEDRESPLGYINLD